MSKIVNKNNLKTILIIMIFVSHLAIVNLVANAEDYETLDNEYPLKLEQIESKEGNVSDVDPVEQIEELNPPSNSNCDVIADGRFEDQSGANGIAGAAWMLCDDGKLVVDEGFIYWTANNSPWRNHSWNIYEIDFTGSITAGRSLRSLFNGLSNVTEIEGLEYFDTTEVTDMSLMFHNMDSLTKLDVSSWVTSNVTNMRWMFNNVRSLTELDVSSWDTSQVTDMRRMFFGARSLTELDVSDWDISQVTNMNEMFMWAYSLTKLDVSSWDTSHVTNMDFVFSGTSSLTELDVSDWDTSQVTIMDSMFSGTSSLAELDVSSWDTSQVTNMDSMFSGTSSLAELDISGWDTSQVRDMSSMFNGASNLTELDVSSWDTSQVRGMSMMFFGASGLTELDVSGWDTSRARSMSWMFGATSLRQLTFGENFVFVDFPLLPEVIQNHEFTGYWQNVGNGTIDNPLGIHVLTSLELGTQFDGSTMIDTFVWQPANRPTTPRATLGQLIEEAEARIQSNYTPRSWANMMSMLTFARSVYNNTSSTNDHINDAINLLRTVLDALVER